MAWEGITEEEMNTKNYEDDAEFWEPNEDDELQGVVKIVKEGKYNKLFMIIKDEDGDSWITSQCASLDKQIKRLKIKAKDTVHITYLGEGEQGDDPSFNAPKLYKLLKWVEE